MKWSSRGKAHLEKRWHAGGEPGLAGPHLIPHHQGPAQHAQQDQIRAHTCQSVLGVGDGKAGSCRCVIGAQVGQGQCQGGSWRSHSKVDVRCLQDHLHVNVSMEPRNKDRHVLKWDLFQGWRMCQQTDPNVKFKPRLLAGPHQPAKRRRPPRHPLRDLSQVRSLPGR